MPRRNHRHGDHHSRTTSGIGYHIWPKSFDVEKALRLLAEAGAGGFDSDKGKHRARDKNDNDGRLTK